MINLLPEQNKQAVTQAIKLRWGVLVIFSLLILGIVLGVLLIPSYLIVSARLSSAQNQIGMVNKSEGFVIDQTMKVVVDDLSKKISVFPDTFSATSTTVGTFFSSIAKVKTNGIYITNVNFIKKSSDDIKVQITGKSDSRNTLYAFSQNLEASEHFSNVVVPVSSFVKGKNTDFLITVNFLE